MERAKAALRVKAVKQSFNGKWAWELRADEELVRRPPTPPSTKAGGLGEPWRPSEHEDRQKHEDRHDKDLAALAAFEEPAGDPQGDDGDSEGWF